MRRPLIPVVGWYVAGILSAAVPVPLPGLFGLAAVLALLFPFWKSQRSLLLGLLLFFGGWINTARLTDVVSPHDLREITGAEPQIATLKGRLIETPRLRSFEIKDRELWTSSARLAVDSARFGEGAWRTAYGTVLCSLTQKIPETFFAGQTVEVSGVLQLPKGAAAEGLFDYREYLRRQGIYRQLSSRAVADWQLVSSPKQPPLADRFCAWARRALALGRPVEDDPLRLEWALTLGWKAGLSDETMEPFVRASTLHIFAVDGLRIAIIAGVLFFGLRRAGLSRVWCGILSLPMLWLYAAMTGWPASAIRALVMLMVIYGGWVLKRPGDLINSLFGAALVILVWEPRQLFQAGFQLSFVVVLCILLLLPALQGWGTHFLEPDPLRPEALQPPWQKIPLRCARHAADLFLTSLAAWAGSIPLVAWYFHVLSPVSGFANLLAVPLCAVVLVCNLCSLLFAAWLPPAAILLNHAGWGFMKAIQITNLWFARLPEACLNVATPTRFGVGLYYLILMSVATGWLWQVEWRKTKFATLTCVGLIWIGFWLHDRPVTRLVVLPLQNAHAVYLSPPAGRPDWLMDCGNESSVSRVVKPFLQAQGVNRLDNFLLTHGESAYTGGAQRLTELFGPRRVYLSALHFRSPSYREFMADRREQLAPVTPLEAGSPIPPWTVLYPRAQTQLSKSADNSLVLRGEFSGWRVLLISNLGREGQNALVDAVTNLTADLVIAGATFRDEPLIEPLLQAIQPRLIVIADSPKSLSEAARRRLRQRLQPPAQVYFTSEGDAVTLDVRPGAWELRTMTGERTSGVSVFSIGNQTNHAMLPR